VRDPRVWLRANQARITIRLAFLVFVLVAVLLPYQSIRNQMDRSEVEDAKHRRVSQLRLIDRMLSPAGQLALANPERVMSPATPLRPVVLPFAEIQADMPSVVLDQVRAVGCPIQFKASHEARLDQGSVCIGLRKGDALEVRGRLLVTGTFVAGNLMPHVFVDTSGLETERPVVRRLQDAHRIQLTLRDGRDQYQWLLPVQLPIDRRTHRVRDGLRLTAFRVDGKGVPLAWRPDFTGAWIAEGECIDPHEAATSCMREHTYSIAIPRDRWGRPDGNPVTPGNLQFDVVVSGPGPDGQPTNFLDSTSAKATAVPFGAPDIESFLAAGESLTIERQTKNGPLELISLSRAQPSDSKGIQSFGETVLKALNRAWAGSDPGREERRSFGLRGADFEMVHRSSAPGLDPELLRTGASVTGYAVLMILVALFAWAAIEVLIMRRVMLLTRRTRSVSLAIRTDGNLKGFNFSELRGKDEIGVLATGLDDLLKRVADDHQRNVIRNQHETSQLRAISHEIRSPLQSLSAILQDSEVGSGYVRRMLKALAALYGSASPSDGIQSMEVDAERMDLAEYLRKATANAPHAGLENVVYKGPVSGIEIFADQSALETAVLHILQNADRYRPKGTFITVSLVCDDATACITIHNNGPHIPEELLERIFDYGVSEKPDASGENDGQGLFVVATYLSKMGGTVTAKNLSDGVSFVIEIPVLKR
jgi:signal transduction histidine kinase